MPRRAVVDQLESAPDAIEPPANVVNRTRMPAKSIFMPVLENGA